MASRTEYRQVAQALRKVLKGRRVTYEELGEKLGISSRTVKRIMHGNDYSMAKLAEVCDAIGIKFFDLMRLAQEEEREESFKLTVEQEEFLATNPKHFKFFSKLVKGLSLQAIKENYGLTNKALVSYVKDLESFGLLDRLSDSQVQLKVKGSAHDFIRNGPLSRTIARRDMQKWGAQLLESGPEFKSFFTSSGTYLSEKSIKEFIKAAEELAARFRLISQRERSLLAESELTKVRWALGIVYPFTSWTDDMEL